MEKNELELRERFERYASREDWSAILIVAALVLEAFVVWWFSSGKSRAESGLLIFVDLTIAIGVYGEFHFGHSAKSAAAELQRISDEKIAASNDSAAKADERAANAELELERLRRQVAWRRVQRDKFLAAIANQPMATVEIMYLRDDPECFDVAQQIFRLLKDAEWEVIAPVPIPMATIASDLDNPTVMSVDGQPSGVTVVANSVTWKESSDLEITPYTSLKQAFSESLGESRGSAGGPHRPPVGTLRVVVAPRGSP